MIRIARRLCLPLLALCALSATACGGPVREELIVNWTFMGQPCTSAGGVSSIQVQIAGESLSPDTFNCAAGAGQATTGADLGGFLLGTYALTVNGLDGNGNIIYSGSETIQIAGGRGASNTFAIDLQTTAVTLVWTFSGKTCAQAGNPTVQVTLDGTALTDGNNNANLPCSQLASDGTQQDGIGVYPLAPGMHTFSFTAASGAQSWSLQNFQVNAIGFQNVTANPDLAAGSGSSCASGACASIAYDFSGLGCSDAQVDTARIYVDGTALNPDLACSGGAVSVSNLAEGSHSFRIVGFRGGTTEYESAVQTANLFAGKTTNVALGATADAPAIGDAALTFQFPAGGPNCAASVLTSISYTLTDPTGVQHAAAQAACGGGPNNTGLVFCDVRAGAACPASSLPGLLPGGWNISAKTQNTSGHVYSISGTFAVANQAQSLYTLTFQ